MIIGSGDIASKLKSVDRKDFIFFASGVSNSSEQRFSEFQKEEDLLWQQEKDLHLVYFSSLCVFYSSTPYAKHKIVMERNVKKWFKHWTIMRLGNITWGNNPHTLLNYLKNRFKNNQPLYIQDSYRFLIDEDEFIFWIKMIPEWNCEMNCPGKRLKVVDIVKNYVYS